MVDIHMPAKSVIEARFDMHEEQCKTDKQALWGKLESIDNKLWVIAGATIMNLIVLVGYLATEGPPWANNATAQLADRGERE